VVPGKGRGYKEREVEMGYADPTSKVNLTRKRQKLFGHLSLLKKGGEKPGGRIPTTWSSDPAGMQVQRG